MDYHLEDFLAPGHSDIFRSAIKHARSQKTSESCGLFVYNEIMSDCIFLPFKNDNIYDPNLFSLNNQDFTKLYQKNQIVSLFHSHIIHEENLSELDIEVAESLALPSMVYSLLTKEFELYYPLSYTPPPLFHRIFIPFFQDCMIFVKDYFYLNLNINLSKDIKNWSRKKKASNENLINTMNKYFYIVDKDASKLVNGDVIVFNPDYHDIFHLGVYDNYHLLHHPIHQLPRKEIFTPDIMNKVYKIYRYKDL